MDDPFSRVWQEIVSRPDGPLAMRFYLQPAMSLVMAFKDGIRDAKADAPPYLWAIFTDPANRAALIRSGWTSVGKIFSLAVVLDLIYQFFVLGGLRPVQGLIVAVTLAVIPYVFVRGPINRLWRNS